VKEKEFNDENRPRGRGAEEEVHRVRAVPLGVRGEEIVLGGEELFG
jgi:hypothetical protein